MTPFNSRIAAWATGHRLVLLAAAVVPTLLAAPAGAQLSEALQAQAQTDKAAGDNQKEINGVRERTQDAESLERYNNQLNAQVKSQETEMASIERQLTEIETTNREVQPLMQQMVDTLDQFVQLDVPFLLEERTARIQNLKDMMARADVTISEKYRQILEAYQIELDYGRSLEAYQGRLVNPGAEPRTVEFVRLGRVTLMYRTLDGSDTGYWDAKQKKWVSDPSYKDDVQQALRVARGGAKELLTVPVPAPQEVRS